jgi:hypothetical protein
MALSTDPNLAKSGKLRDLAGVAGVMLALGA